MGDEAVRQDIVRKIQSLIRLSENNPEILEALAAGDKAKALVDKYDILPEELIAVLVQEIRKPTLLESIETFMSSWAGWAKTLPDREQ